MLKILSYLGVLIAGIAIGGGVILFGGKQLRDRASALLHRGEALVKGGGAK